MIKKSDVLNKNNIISVFAVFAVITVKLMYEFSRLGKLLPKYLILNTVAAVALTVFLAVCLIPVVSKNKINGQSFFGILSIVYLIAFNIDEFIIRIDVLSFFIVISAMLLLTRKIWGLIVVALAGAVMSYHLWHAAADCLPAVMCVSMVRYAYLFKKEKPLSKKKAKKNASAEPSPDYKKEKIVFIVCEAVMAASLLATTIIHSHYVNKYQWEYNLRYYAFPAVLVIILTVFAVVALKQKRGIVEAAAYIVPAFCLPIAAVSEYTMAVDYGTALLFTCFMICEENCIFAETADKLIGTVMSKISRKEKE